MQLTELEALLKGRFIQHENDDGDYMPGEVIGLIIDASETPRHRIVSQDAAGAIRVESLDFSGRFFATREACQRAIDGEADEDVAEAA